MGQKKVSFIERCPHLHARVVVGVGKGVLFREVSSVQGCPYRGVPLYITCCTLARPHNNGNCCGVLVE